MEPETQGNIAIGCAIATVVLTVLGLGVIAVVPFIASILLAMQARRDERGYKKAELAEKILIGFIVLLIAGILFIFGRGWL